MKKKLDRKKKKCQTLKKGMSEVDRLKADLEVANSKIVKKKNKIVLLKNQLETAQKNVKVEYVDKIVERPFLVEKPIIIEKPVIEREVKTDEALDIEVRRLREELFGLNCEYHERVRDIEY